MPRMILTAVALASLFIAAPAAAFDGVAASSGEGPDQASACQTAKTNAPLAVGAALQLQGQYARTRIVGFGACLCAQRNDSQLISAYRPVVIVCTVDAQYEILPEE